MGYCPDIKSTDCERDNLGCIVRHRHCEVIKAWADGATIQFWSPLAEAWLPVAGNNPSWGDGDKYRVKPETVRYRVAFFKHKRCSPYTNSTESEDQARRWEGVPGFIRWLTPWQEVEV